MKRTADILVSIDDKLGHALRRLLSELRRLAPNQGRIARRNAVNAIRAQTRRLLSRIEAEYPVERRAKKQRARRSSAQLRKDLKAAGWRVIVSTEVLSRCASAGIRTRRVKGDDGTMYTYAPAWVVGRSVSELATARMDIKLRKALATRVALEGSQP